MRSLSGRISALASVLLVALAAALATPVQGAHAAAPLKLMIAGDSISHEFAGDYTWRYRLRQEFSRQHVYVDFVGPRTGNTRGLPLIPWSDDQHDALGGTTLSVQVPQIGADVTKYQPDVMLLMMGFNDLNHGASQQDVVDLMDQYLSNVFAAKPDIKVVLSHVLDTVIYPGTDHRLIPIAEVNQGYDDLVAKYQGLGRSITIADHTADWEPGPRMTVDGVHPTPTGEMVIASRYATSLHELDPPILPEPSGIPLASVPWVTPARPTVRQLAHRQVEFRWDAWTTRLTSFRGQIYVYGGHLTHPLRLYGPWFGSSVTHYLPRGYYGVKLSPTRKWLIGRWGPIVHFRVR